MLLFTGKYPRSLCSTKVLHSTTSHPIRIFHPTISFDQGNKNACDSQLDAKNRELDVESETKTKNKNHTRYNLSSEKM